MENKGNSKTIIAVLITLLICLIGFCVFLLIDKSNKVNNDNNGEVNNKTENNSKIENEVELTDETVKADVLDKMNMIFDLTDEGINKETSFSINNYSLSVLPLHNMENIYKELFDSHSLISLTNGSKLKIALSATKSKETTRPYEERNFKDKDKGYLGLTFLGEISINDLKNTYKNLFNEEINEFSDTSYFTHTYYYDSINNCYYKVQAEIGMTGPNMNKLYINNITKNDNFVYIYMNYVLAVATSDNVFICDINDYFEDNNCSNKVIIDKYDNSKSDAIYDVHEIIKNYKLDESNYKDFTNYRFVFKKNSEGNYYFDKVEKVK